MNAYRQNASVAIVSVFELRWAKGTWPTARPPYKLTGGSACCNFDEQTCQCDASLVMKDTLNPSTHCLAWHKLLIG